MSHNLVHCNLILSLDRSCNINNFYSHWDNRQYVYSAGRASSRPCLCSTRNT